MNKSVVLIIVLVCLFSGCGSDTNTSNVSKGVFLDSAVEGLTYESHHSGITDSNGTFKYFAGDKVSFYIADVLLGQTSAKDRITPVDLVHGAVDETDPTATNICRLLQSLDVDGNPDNGIRITDEINELVRGKNIVFNQSISDFETDPAVLELFTSLNEMGVFKGVWERTLCSAEQAQRHLRRSLAGGIIAGTTHYIEREMAKQKAVGLSIALVDANGVIWAEGFGWADKEKEIKVTPDTIYMLGSISKSPTAVSLLQLHEQGIISIDDPAVNYLPDFTMAERYPNQLQEMTVRRLLNHHAGIPGDLFNNGVVEESWDRWGCHLYTDWLLDYLKTDYPGHPPGEMTVYSNTGFVLAGEIALKMGGVEGETYSDFLDRVLFSPLGMSHTSLKKVSENLAKGYENGTPAPIVEMNCTFGATGGIYSSVQDMARFIMILINAGRGPDGVRILNPETVAMMGDCERSVLDIHSFWQPGLGLDTVADPALHYAGRAWMKNGSTGGYNSSMAVLPDLKLGVIVLTNSDTAHDLPAAVARECLKNAIYEKYGIAPSPAPTLPEYPSVNEPSVIAGVYVKKTGYDRVDDNGDGTLTWTRDAHHQAPAPYILAFNGKAYCAKDRTERLRFMNLPWGGTNHFVMVQSGSSGSDLDDGFYGGYVRQIIGEKMMVSPAIPNAWKGREGLCVIDNLPWNDSGWAFPFSQLSEKDGFLIIDGEYVAIPQNDTLAFLPGLNNRADSSLRVVQHNGVGKMLFGGYRSYAIDEMPTIAGGDVIHGTGSLHKTDWFRLEKVLPTYSLDAIIDEGEDYVLTVFDSSFTLVGRERGSISWTPKQLGSYYLAVTPTPDAGENHTYTLWVNEPLGVSPSPGEETCGYSVTAEIVMPTECWPPDQWKDGEPPLMRGYLTTPGMATREDAQFGFDRYDGKIYVTFTQVTYGEHTLTVAPDVGDPYSIGFFCKGCEDLYPENYSPEGVIAAKNIYLDPLCD
ncbi:MAG: beta-lactamase family protein [Deltaproteobacteria bacterium]|nr:beta-lactamase family protein [Deltaproteobacteria bacterium]